MASRSKRGDEAGAKASPTRRDFGTDPASRKVGEIGTGPVPFVGESECKGFVELVPLSEGQHRGGAVVEVGQRRVIEICIGIGGLTCSRSSGKERPGHERRTRGHGGETAGHTAPPTPWPPPLGAIFRYPTRLQNRRFPNFYSFESSWRRPRAKTPVPTMTFLTFMEERSTKMHEARTGLDPIRASVLPLVEGGRSVTASGGNRYCPGGLPDHALLLLSAPARHGVT